MLKKESFVMTKPEQQSQTEPKIPEVYTQLPVGEVCENLTEWNGEPLSEMPIKAGEYRTVLIQIGGKQWLQDHIDFKGMFLGQMFDTSSVSIRKLRWYIPPDNRGYNPGLIEIEMEKAPKASAQTDESQKNIAEAVPLPVIDLVLKAELRALLKGIVNSGSDPRFKCDAFGRLVEYGKLPKASLNLSDDQKVQVIEGILKSE